MWMLGRVSVERIVADGLVRFSVTVDSSTASQLLYRLSSGPMLPSVGILEAAPEPELPVVRRPLALERSGEIEPALEVEADGVGVERLAVVERHALAEVERPRETVVARRPVGRRATESPRTCPA